ncbi:NADH:flavin oxidoreductase/NADH oxidase [Ochrobactrum sp. Q0168]|uniref:NADH:flavin oxidoreductase/NADH oxidase n=1 Tax=Ochrobactrum sp. Q0168 TaxID=2793241 RepID=UPI0018EA8D4B|nr:NADH:flavin oxidoreductase/NADH oxidase [Ochrobactrum sp. Q0168]
MIKLFSPIKVGGLELVNRIAISPMCQYMAKADGKVTPWHTMHYGSLAVSGAGVVIIEASAVSPEGRISPCDLAIYNADQEEHFRELLSNIRTYSSTPIGLQLAHAGRKSSSEPFDSPNPVTIEQGGWIPIGPSSVRVKENWPAPNEMSLTDIDDVIASFVSAATRADRAGFDLIEIHGAHGYLISSFLSNIANLRTDKYGGSLEHRMLFAITLARAVRKVWPRSKAIGFRLNGSDWVESGISVEETAKVAAKLKDIGIDYVSVSSGGNSSNQKLPPVTPGYQAPLAASVRKLSGLTTMALGMILEGPQAEGILSSGQADLIGIARAALDNPRWPLHAAQSLGVKVEYPRPHWRAASGIWPGYDIVHKKG